MLRCMKWPPSQGKIFLEEFENFLELLSRLKKYFGLYNCEEPH
jgi:hypothetical protein